jgi:hypothetical protein
VLEKSKFENFLIIDSKRHHNNKEKVFSLLVCSDSIPIFPIQLQHGDTLMDVFKKIERKIS